MSSILQDLESKITGLKAGTTKSNVGYVREIGDGVAKIEGLSEVMLNEMLEFPGGVYGLALTPWPGAVGSSRYSMPSCAYPPVNGSSASSMGMSRST